MTEEPKKGEFFNLSDDQKKYVEEFNDNSVNFNKMNMALGIYNQAIVEIVSSDFGANKIRGRLVQAMQQVVGIFEEDPYTEKKEETMTQKEEASSV